MPLLPHPAPSCRLEYGHDRWCPSSHRGPRVTLRTKATNKEGEQKESRSQRHTSLGLTTSTFHLMSSLLSRLLCVLGYMQPKPASAPLATFGTTSHAKRIPSKRQLAAEGIGPHPHSGAMGKPPWGDVSAEDQRGRAAWGGGPELRPRRGTSAGATAARRPRAQPGKGARVLLLPRGDAEPGSLR